MLTLNRVIKAESVESGWPKYITTASLKKSFSLDLTLRLALDFGTVTRFSRNMFMHSTFHPWSPVCILPPGPRSAFNTDRKEDTACTFVFRKDGLEKNEHFRFFALNVRQLVLTWNR